MKVLSIRIREPWASIIIIGEAEIVDCIPVSSDWSEI